MTTVIDGTLGLTTPTYGGTVTGEYTVPVTAFKNRIINGAMMIDQRNAGASVTIDGATSFTLDRWNCTEIGNGAFTVQQVTDAPSGFKNSLKVSVSTAQTGTLNASTRQAIEGYNIADLGWGAVGAATVTLSFWVKSSLTGTFGGALKNSANDRSYVFSYTIVAANTWEQKSITIAGDTTGTWLTDNSTGINVWFSLGTGTTNTAGAWYAGDYRGVTGQVNVISTLSATWQLTGVQLEKGSTATSFDYRPYGTELQLCQRYLPAFNNQGGGSFSILGTGFCGSSTAYYAQATFPVPTRVQPTGLVVSSPTYFTANPFVTGGGAASAVTFASASNNMGRVILTTSGMTNGAGGDWAMNSAAANLYFTGCEL